MTYFESTVLVASDLMVAVTVTVEGSKHDTEGSGPLAEEDEEMMSQRLLREEKAPVVDCGEREKETRRVNMGDRECTFKSDWHENTAKATANIY